MTIVITSFSPETGPVTGDTLVTVAGTGLIDVDVVLVGTEDAEIVGTPTATQVKFRTPLGAAIGNAEVILGDTSAPSGFVAATDPFAYAAASEAEVLVSTFAKKFRVDVSDDQGTTWNMGVDAFKVRGITTLKPSVDTQTEDDSDYDGDEWGSTVKTQLGWALAMTCKRGKGIVSGSYDPGQQVLWDAHDQLGGPGSVLVRWYDRTGGPEAYQGTAQVQWAPQGGDTKTTDKVDVTLAGQGKRTKITNPVIANPALAT